MKKLIAGILLTLSVRLYADQQAIGPPWAGLNNSDASFLIGDNESQDLSNVDLTESAYGVKKRAGYAQFKTIGTSTWGVRGGYYFRDAGGNNNIIHANDISVFRSRTGGAYSAFYTTATSASYFDFTDSNGSLWIADSNNDTIESWNGTTLTSYSSLPKGTQIEALPDRLAISGTTANPNRIAKSKKADFATFATGPLNADPYTFDVGLPGTQITALKWFGDRLLWWTRNTLGYDVSVDQYDLSPIGSISNTIGTTQPNAVVEDLGIVYFQGQDNHFYATDGNSISRISRKLDVSNIVQGQSLNWLQTTQADFTAGTVGNGLSVAASPGDVMFSTTGVLHDDFSDGDYTGSPTWNLTMSSIPATVTITSGGIDFSVSNASGATDSTTLYGSTFTSTTGPFVFVDYTPVTEGSAVALASIILSTGGATVSPNGIGVTLKPAGYAVTQAIHRYQNGIALTQLGTFSKTFVTGTNYQIKLVIDTSNNIVLYIDGVNVLGGGIADTTFAGQLFKSVHVGLYSPGTLSTYRVRFDNVRIPTASSIFQSQTYNIETAISSWGAFDVNHTLAGGTIAYAIYGDANSAITISNAATFTSSQTITVGAIPTIATAAYVTWAATFARTTSTQTPTLNDVTVNWYEGTVTRHWASVDKDHRIIWSVAEGTNTVPNVSYIYDTRHDAWLKYGFPMDAPAKAGDSLYFGGVSTGVVYQWPSGNTDNGNAITAYWKSKDFISKDAFTEKDYKSVYLITKTQPGSNLDLTWVTDTYTSATRNIGLADANSALFRRYNDNYAIGTRGSFFNFKFGNDDGDAPFEVYSVKYDFDILPSVVIP